MSEFDLIRKHFTRPTKHTTLGIGDDAALIPVSAGIELAISTDMLVAGTHFFADVDPHKLGWKSLAVNLSDMAAMGAKPKWATLSISLPENDATWLSHFSQGFFSCADAFDVDLIGGDTTRGPLNISVQIIGEIPIGQAIRRSGAKIDDDIWVSGKLGCAALGLAHILGKQQMAANSLAHHLQALHCPQPRVLLGLALRGLVHSCLDISDGLLSDLGHIVKASNVGAEIHLDAIPTSTYIKKHLKTPAFQQYVLAGGDDYELCFTAPERHAENILIAAKNINIPVVKIGKITATHGINVVDTGGNPIQVAQTGYNHFN
ncbi:MAG: thiamine-phosphate kinase [Methylotenera sp.]|nr:thiamine-phosphate kinase [Methylotenera sp.]